MAERFVQGLLEMVEYPERQKAYLGILQEAQKGEVRIDITEVEKTGMAYVLREAGLVEYKGTFYKDDTYATCSAFEITMKGKDVANEWTKQK